MILNSLFASCLRDSIYNFLQANGFIDHRIQKGFLPKLSGTFEYIPDMANVINQARIKQRSLAVTFLDLQNAFREVHHNLIPEILKYHTYQNAYNNLFSLSTRISKLPL